MNDAPSGHPEYSTRPELNSRTDVPEHLARSPERADAVTIEDMVRSLDSERSLALLKHLIKCLEGVDALVHASAAHEAGENPLKLAPHYLTGETRLLIEWWFLPVLHRLKAEMLRTDSQAPQTRDGA